MLKIFFFQVWRPRRGCWKRIRSPWSDSRPEFGRQKKFFSSTDAIDIRAHTPASLPSPKVGRTEFLVRAPKMSEPPQPSALLLRLPEAVLQTCASFLAFRQQRRLVATCREVARRIDHPASLAFVHETEYPRYDAELDELNGEMMRQLVRNRTPRLVFRDSCFATQTQPRAVGS